MKIIFISNYIFRSICVISATILLFNGIKGWGLVCCNHTFIRDNS